MDEKEQLYLILKNQSAINGYIKKILESLTISGDSPELEELRKLIKLNQSLLSEFEKKI